MPTRSTFRVSRPAPPSKNKRNQKQTWKKARRLAKTSGRRTLSGSLMVLILGLLVIGLLLIITRPFSPDSEAASTGAQAPQSPPVAGSSIPAPALTGQPAATPARVTPGLPPTAAPTLLSPTPTKAPTTLEEAANSVIAREKAGLGENAAFGLMIHNLDTGDKFEINSDKLFESASLYKLFTMLTVYYDISGGRLSLDDQITLLPDADASAEDGYTIVTPGNSLPVRELLEHMIVDSNNTAGLMLLFQVRAARMQTIVADLGFTESDFSDTWNFRVTAQDLDLFFSRLADQKLLGPKYDQPMLDLLSRTQPRDRIPALLPPGTHTANKTGNLDGVINDSGIVYLPNGNRLLISVLIHNVNDATGRQFIADLSLAVYNFYNTSKP
jgi:beta-lactamase class A